RSMVRLPSYGVSFRVTSKPSTLPVQELFARDTPASAGRVLGLRVASYVDLLRRRLGGNAAPVFAGFPGFADSGALEHPTSVAITPTASAKRAACQGAPPASPGDFRAPVSFSASTAEPRSCWSCRRG